MTDDDVSWGSVKRTIPVGFTLNCIVTKHEIFGIFVKCGDDLREGFVEALRMQKDGYKIPDQYPPVGSTVLGTVLGYREWSKQIELALEKRTVEQVAEHGSSSYFCPLYGRDIAEGKCLEINYERLGYLSAGCLVEVSVLTGKKELEISTTCKGCPNLPFRDELGTVTFPSPTKG